MSVQGIHLCWIVVKDLNKAIDFYTKYVGLKVSSHSPEWGWAELSGPQGTLLGIAQEQSHEPIKAGMNAVLTVSVDSLEEECNRILKMGGRFQGDVVEVPGHVKMRTMVDPDGNHLQLVQSLS